MPLFDLPLSALETYAPSLPEPENLDEFWRTTLAEARAVPLDVTFNEVDNHYSLVTTYDVTFPGFGGDPIKGWLHVPATATGPLATVVEYLGYSGGRGLAHQRQSYALAGYAHFVMDSRGQGWNGTSGDTIDPHPSAGSNAVPGQMTHGILEKNEYVYRRLITDAVRAVEAAAVSPWVDADRIVVAGGSQGGGLALLTASLGRGIRGALIDVPFLCHFTRAITITDAVPYSEIARYLSRYREHTATVYDTLSYFDGAILANRATVPALFSVALMDVTCPPSTVFAAYNRYGGEKDIVVYPFNGHEGGAEAHEVERYRWLKALFATNEGEAAA